MLSLLSLILLYLQNISVTAITLNSSSLILPKLTSAALPALGAPFERQCNGTLYGHNIPLESCADALLQINASDTTVRSYGLRGTGRFDVDLPRRYISGESQPPSSKANNHKVAWEMSELLFWGRRWEMQARHRAETGSDDRAREHAAACFWVTLCN